jgi:hypothetical protein
MRREFFGPEGDTSWNQKRLEEEFGGFRHHEVDIRDRAKVLEIIREITHLDYSQGGATPSIIRKPRTRARQIRKITKFYEKASFKFGRSHNGPFTAQPERRSLPLLV